jgi:hypothetical protein
MKFLKYFNEIKLLIESIISFNKIRNWKIFYNHGVNHNLDDRLIRSKLSEKDFEILLNKIIYEIDKDKLNGDYIFYMLKYDSKIVVNINLGKSVLYIVTILNRDHSTNSKNIKIII